MMSDFYAPELASLDLPSYMSEALREADAAGAAGELPIGAVLVIDGDIVARGRARHRAMRSDIRHAELNALLEGGDRLWEHPDKAILFTTVEPCILCLGAAVMADVPHIVFALRDGLVQSNQIVRTNSYVRRHLRSYYGGVLQRESQALFQTYDPKALAYIQTHRDE